MKKKHWAKSQLCLWNNFLKDGRSNARYEQRTHKWTDDVASIPGLSRIGARVRKRGFMERVVVEGGRTKSAKKNKWTLLARNNRSLRGTGIAGLLCYQPLTYAISPHFQPSVPSTHPLSIIQASSKAPYPPHHNPSMYWLLLNWDLK